MKVFKIWYCCLIAVVCGRPIARLATRSHIPSELSGGAPPSPDTRWPLLVFRKIHLYGNFKKSTHGTHPQQRTTPLPPAPGFLVPSALPRPPAASPCTSSACAAAAGRAARWSRVAVQGRWCRVAPAPCTAHTGATEPSQAKCPVRRPWPGAQPALCLSARALAAPGSRRPRPQAAKGNNKPHTRGPHDGTTTTSPAQNGMRAAGDEHRQARTALNGLPAFPGTPLHARGRRRRLLPVQGPG